MNATIRLNRVLYSIERTSYGLLLTLGDTVTVADMTRLKAELPALFATLKRPFGVIADIRTAIPFSPEVKMLIQECEQISRDAGLQRRAVVFRSPVVRNQATQLSFQSKTDSIERRINADMTDDWEKLALAWVVDGVEPSLTPNPDGGLKQPS